MSDFLQQAQGPQGVSFTVPKPIISQEGVSPVVGQLARAYSEEASNVVKQRLGRRGMLGSSGYSSMLEGAFRHGWDRAIGDVQRERDMFSRWSLANLQMAQAVPAQEPELGGFERSLGYGLQGAQIGATFGGTGAAIGGLAGLVGGLLSS